MDNLRNGIDVMLQQMLIASGGNTGPTSWETLVASLTPLMWLRMSETTGALADASGNGNNGTITGTTTRGAPAIYSGMGLCMAFPTGTTNNVSVADNAGLQLTGDLTILIAMKRSGSAVGTFPKLFWKPTDYANGRANYGLIYNRSTNRVTFRVNASSTYYDASPTATIADNTPYLVSGRRSGTEVSCWLNGVKEATAALPSSGTVLDTNTSPIYIGGQSSNTTDLWGHWLDEAIIFNRALSDTEISDLYAARA